MHMRNLIVALMLLAAGYALGGVRTTASADDNSKMIDLLREIARAEATQADALKTIARASEKCAK